MREILKRLLKMMMGYGAVQWAGPFLSLIFTPIITRILTPGDYGIADFLITVLSATSTLALFGLPQALVAHFNDRPDENRQKQLVGSALALSTITGVSIGLILFLAASQISALLLKNQSYTALLRFIGVVSIIGVYGNILVTAAQAGLQVKKGVLFSSISILFTVTGNILFIIWLRLGATGMVLVPITTSMMVGLVALAVMRKSISFPSLSLMKVLAISGAILLPNLLSGWALMLVDRFFLVRLVTPEVLGHYAIANKIASLIQVGMGPLYAVWTPLMLSIQREPEASERYAIMSRYLIIAVLTLSLGLGLFSREILLILTRPAYLPASPYVGYLTYMHVFTGLGMVLYANALANKRLGATSISVMVGAGVNILLNFILIPRWGVWGAVWASVIGYAVPQIILYILLRPENPVTYPLAKIMAVLIMQAGLLTINLFLPAWPFWLEFFIKLLLFMALFLGMIWVKFITPFELYQFQLFVKNQWKLNINRMRLS